MKIERTKKDKRIKYSLFSFLRFILYLLLTIFIVTCSFLLFFRSGIEIDILYITNNSIGQKAYLIFLNILFVCIILSAIDVIKKKITIERPVKKILDATHRITHGDFSARITPRNTKSMRNELDLIIDDFNIMAESISRTETLKTDFITNVSHEIKTPLSVIHNYSVLLQSKDLSENKRIEYAKKLEDSSLNLAELITNILRLNKLENQQTLLQNNKYPLDEQLCECLLLFDEQIAEKELNIVTDFDETLLINSDRELLEIVWTNLISNAIKFTNKNGTIIVSTKKVNENISVTISDTGCGMTEQTGMRIFEKFYQADSSRATKGNGLGLALVKRVIDIIGAEITVKSELNKGSSFTVKIPVTNNILGDVFYD